MLSLFYPRRAGSHLVYADDPVLCVRLRIQKHSRLLNLDDGVRPEAVQAFFLPIAEAVLLRRCTYTRAQERHSSQYIMG